MFREIDGSYDKLYVQAHLHLVPELVYSRAAQSSGSCTRPKKRRHSNYLKFYYNNCKAPAVIHNIGKC